MTMHLAHPSLTMTGKRKSKRKFRNAEEARRSRELAQGWEELKKRHGIVDEERKRNRAMSADVYVPPKLTYRGADAPKILSLGDGMGIAAKKDSPVYTGTKIKGIGTMHKSNAVPIFTDDEAKDIASMRR